MMQDPRYIAQLILGYLSGSLSTHERQVLDAWLAASERNRHFFVELTDEDVLLKLLEQGQPVDKAMLEKQILDKVQQRRSKILSGNNGNDPDSESSMHVVPVKRMNVLRFPGFRVAAAAIAIITAGTFYYLANRTSNNDPGITAVKLEKDPLPGKQGAVLTLADGSTILLDSMEKGIIANQQGTAVLLKDGQLTYDARNASEITYNTMSTPRGRQFHIRLPDGTLVWLNAGSSLTYPTAFAGNERMVQVKGEAFFEVTKQYRKDGKEHMPFIVQIQSAAGELKGEVEVLGTDFNINAYADEPGIKATLLKGSVRVRAFNELQLLRPGQQATIANDPPVSHNGIQIKTIPDPDAVVAWKNGAFSFSNKSFDELMRQLCRWYDIEVVYENGIPQQEFEGKVSRDVPLSDVLVFFRRSGIDFRLEEGKRLVVTQ